MKSVLHVIDGSGDETHFQVLATLRSRRTAEGQRHHVCTIDPAALPLASSFLGNDLLTAPVRLLRALNYAPALAKLVQEINPGVVHVWGVKAAVVAATKIGDRPLVMTMLKPEITRQAAEWLRSLPKKTAIACGSQVIRSHMLRFGMQPDHTVVIRGPADFAETNLARKQNIRSTLVGDARPVILLDGPPSPTGGQFYAIWAAAVLSKFIGGIRVIMPYGSRESLRLRRFAERIGVRDMLIVPPGAYTWSQLAASADVFCCPATDDICTEPVIAAMAANIPIVGSAVRSIAEMIADRHNGLLCKSREPRSLAAKLLTILEDQELGRRLAEVARGQAYEVFSVRAFADNYARLYENITCGRSAGDGIIDTAMVA